MNWTWEAVNAISAALATFVVVFGALYAYFQVREARQGRHVSMLLAFRDRYHSMPDRQFRARLLRGHFGTPDEIDPEQFSEDDYHRFWELHDQLEVLGVLVDRRLVDFDLVRACFHRSPPMVWEAIGPYIVRRRQTSTPYEGIHFERLVGRYERSGAFNVEYWSRREP